MTFPVMMVHGMCCTGDVWLNFRRYFEERGSEVHTPTLRPEQRTRSSVPRSLGQVTLADYVEDLVQEVARVEQACGERPALIGHSMGGLLAQLLAERNLVRAAVFISPTAPIGARDRRDRAMWASIRFFGALGMVPGIIRVAPRTANRGVLNVADDDARKRANATFVAESGRAFRDFATCDIDSERIEIPVLTVAAGRDRLVPARSTRLVGKKYAAVGGDFIEYDNHGHWLYDEPGWEQPAEEIFEWLQRKTQG